MNRQSWRIEEDQAISKLVATYGINDWTKIAEKLKQTYSITKRTGKQCRQRWYNHLNPAVNKKPWNNQEQTLLFQLHKAHGNKWKQISCFFLGRTDNDIKNHFYSTLRRSLRRLNKISGEKNSTSQMRQIKPSVLSTIMSFIYNQQLEMQKNLRMSLQDLPILIFEYANFKPIKNNIRSHPREDSRSKIYEIFELINRFNDQYQRNKQSKHQKKAIKRNVNQKSSPDPSTIFQSSLNHYQYTLYLQKSQTKNKRNNCSNDDEVEDSFRCKQQEIDLSDGEESIMIKEEQENQQYDYLCNEQEKKNKNFQEGLLQNMNELFRSKRSLSLQQQDLEQQEAEMPSMIQPDRYTFQGEEGQEQQVGQLDLTVVGHRWQPQNWETQLQMKYIDQVLEMNYDVV